MSYCTLADILEQMDSDELIQLTDDGGTGAVDGAVVSRAIEDADAEIDAYCSGRYDVPFDPIPNLIRKISVDLAVYHLYRRRGAPESRQVRYDAALKLLANIARGLVSIGATGVAESAGAVSSRASSQRVFSNEGLEGY